MPEMAYALIDLIKYVKKISSHALLYIPDVMAPEWLCLVVQ